MVDKTNLRGLAVPMEPAGLFVDFAAGRGGNRLFGRDAARSAYGAYLAAHFPSRLEGRSWTVLSRAWHEPR
jgi:hypothetical protein